MEAMLHRETTAALAGIERSLAAPAGVVATPDLVLIPLARVGDALRLGVEVPRAVSRWLAALAPGVLSGALRALADEAATWSLPAPGADADDDPHLAFAVRRRDEAESTRLSVTRACLARGLAPASLGDFATFQARLAGFDAALREVASRRRVELLLGTRAGLLGSRPWTAALADDDAQTAAGDATLPWGDALLASPPTDDAVTRYATAGAHARLVEEYARRSPAFVEELASAIDGLLALQESVGLAARRWRQHAALPSTSDSAALPVRPRLRAAAATEASEAETHEVLLGRLAPVAADARLVCSSRVATLCVYGAPAAITRVEFGGRAVTAPDARGVWVVEIPLPEEAVALRVVSPSGEEFAMAVTLVEAET